MCGCDDSIGECLEWETCEVCDGDGYIYVVDEDEERKKITCSTCNGTGVV